MRTLLAVALLVPVVALAENRTESRKISDFHALDVSGGVKVDLKRGAPALTLEGDADAIAALSVDVKDGVLVVRRDKAKWKDFFSQRAVTVRATTTQLDAVDASGGVEISLADVTTRKLHLALSGGVSLKATRVKIETLELSASGGAELTLSGVAHTASFDLSGGVNLDARDLKVASADLDASGGCDVKLFATEAVKGEASGGVSVDVYGNPPVLAVDTSGAATVDRLN